MKICRIVILVLVALAALTIYFCDHSDAAETDSDGSVYEYDTYGSGHPDYYCIITHVQSDSEILHAPAVLEGYDVRYIASHSFDGCAVKSLILPVNLVGISEDAFTGCPHLTDIYFMGDRPTMDGAFDAGVTFHAMPGREGWDGVDKIQTVTSDGIIYAILPDGAAVTGGVPSEGVLDIRSEVNGVTVKRISEYSFAGTMKGDGTVERRSDIERAVLPNGLVSIGQRAFYYNNIKEINVPDTVSSIRDEAFRACTYLEEIAFPEGLQYIGFESFRDCHSLTGLIIPNSVVFAGDGAFYICDSLKSVKVSSDISPRMFGYCSSLEKIDFGDGVSNLGYGCFYRCESLRSVTVPDSVRLIPSEAFRGCIELKELDLGKTENIGRMAFRDCSSLKGFDLPETVRSIAGYAFADCTALKDIYAYGSAPEGDNTVFLNDPATIHCRENHLESWEESGFELTVKGDLKEQSSDILMIAGLSAVMIVILAFTIIIFLWKKG